jgi:PPP family 3-phenylpropionic acid transporter
VDLSPVLPSRARCWAGLAVFYVTVFAVLGVYIQFFPLWLYRVRGLSEAEVAWVFTAQTAARTIAGPLWAQHADNTGRPRRALVLLALLSLSTFALYGLATAPWALIGCGLLFGCCYPAIHSIQDALAMAAAHQHGFAYGRLRLVGSLAFLLTAIVLGEWLCVAPTAIVFACGLGGLVLVFGTSFLLPELPAEVPSAPAVPTRAPIGQLLRIGPFVLLLAVAALIQGSHAVYYNLSTIHWSESGIATSTTGLLWAEGVLAEIALFFVARGSLDRLRPTTMLALGGAVAALRWTVLGLTTSVPLLFAANWLHGFSFGCTFLGSLRAIERRVPPAFRATAQGLLGAAASGIGLVVASPIGGYCYGRFRGGAFLAMALLALAGTALALVLRRQAAAAAQAQSRTAASPE